MITRYIAQTRISRIEERFTRQRRIGTIGVGERADMVDVSTGWWIVTENPEPYAVCAGTEKPLHAVGDHIRLIVEIGETEEERRQRFIDLIVSQRPPHATNLVKGLGGSYHVDEQMGVYHIVGVRDEESIYLLERNRCVGEEHKYYASEEDYARRRYLDVSRIRQRVVIGG